MAKKSVKKAASKAGKKAATVHVDMRSLKRVEKAAHKAGLGADFKRALGRTKKTVFVQIDRKNFHGLKDLIKNSPKLADHPHVGPVSDCDCDPKDPFCFCI
jgi:hypothetical protein